MATGNFWNITDDPLKPYGPFDPDGIYDIPFDWVTWLAGLAGGADTYLSHVITVQSGLQLMGSSGTGGLIIARIKASGSPVLILKKKYFINCHIVTVNGQEEDQTLYFKIVEK